MSKDANEQVDGINKTRLTHLVPQAPTGNRKKYFDGRHRRFSKPLIVALPEDNGAVLAATTPGEGSAKRCDGSLRIPPLVPLI